MPTLVVGITGNIASGKSTVSRGLELRGAARLDADRVVHDLYRAGQPGAKAIAEAFGKKMLDEEGNVDRAALAKATMGDKKATRRLEKLVHPLVKEAIEGWIAEQRARGGVKDAHLAVIEATLTYEAGTDDRHDLMVVVDVPLETRRQRAIARGLTAGEFDRRESRMMAPEEKRERADIVVDNSGTESDLEEAIDRLDRELRIRAEDQGEKRI